MDGLIDHSKRLGERMYKSITKQLDDLLGTHISSSYETCKDRFVNDNKSFWKIIDSEPPINTLRDKINTITARSNFNLDSINHIRNNSSSSFLLSNREHMLATSNTDRSPQPCNNEGINI